MIRLRYLMFHSTQYNSCSESGLQFCFVAVSKAFLLVLSFSIGKKTDFIGLMCILLEALGLCFYFFFFFYVYA